MNYKNEIIAAILAAIVLFGGIWIGQHQIAPKAGDINGGVNYIQTVGTNKAVNISATSAQVLATSTARTFVELSATSTVYCSLDADKPATNGGVGITIGLGQPFIINASNLYIGAIECIAPSATNLSVTAAQ